MIQRLTSSFKAAQQVLVVDTRQTGRQERIFSMSRIGADLYTLLCKNAPFTPEEEAVIAVEFGGKQTSLRSYNDKHQPHGPWAFYDKDKLVAEGNYVIGQKHGLWVYHTNNREERIHYDQDKKHGAYVLIDRKEGGPNVTVGEYRSNQKTGRWQIISPESRITGHMENGKKHGIWVKRSSKNNTLKLWAEFNQGEEIVSGTSILKLHEYKHTFNELNQTLLKNDIPQMETPPNLQVLRI